MTIYQNAKELGQLKLGKATQYTTHYNANLLQGVSRSLNRDNLMINRNKLPFCGEDVWYGYELSWLNSRGKPIVAVAEFRFSCTSKNLIESKSFKLYLNSFNQTRFDTWQQVQTRLTTDLSACAETNVAVKLFKVDNCPALIINEPHYSCIDDIDVHIIEYNYHADLLLENKNKKTTNLVEESLVSHLLKSNCLITNQPDWASLFIHYRGQQISHTVLLKYLISFRQHNEFHEQCVERIFCDLQNYYQLEQLTVFARYTRRGGLDINPFRSTHLDSAPNFRTMRQ